MAARFASRSLFWARALGFGGLSERGKLLMKDVQGVRRDLANWQILRVLLVWPAA
jgi:hypothetical protein